MTVNWRVGATEGGHWSITSPSGARWTGAPSQPAAYNLAQSLAGIDAMLAEINRPSLALVTPHTCRKRRRDYGFGPVRPTGGQRA